MADTVKVGTTNPAGMRLHVYDWTDDPQLPGHRIQSEIGVIDLPPHNDGDPVTAAVDAALFETWMAAHIEADIVRDGVVFRQGATSQTKA